MTKRMTKKYWENLEEGSKRRALSYVFPLYSTLVDNMVMEKPNPKNNPFWKVVWMKVRIPYNNTYYKTYINQTYLP